MDNEKLIGWMQARFAREQGHRPAAKYELLTQVILQAIREKILAPGDRLPPEQHLSQHLPVSQITVRKSYAKLGQIGIISREHGRGTFVSDAEQSVSDLWHYRFRDPETDGLMPIYNRILSLDLHSETSAGTTLHKGGGKLIRIERAVNIGSRFNCYSELYLPFERFSGIMDLSHSELERVNLKDIMAEQFNAPTLRVNQHLRIDTLPERAAKTVDSPAGTKVLLLRVVGYTFDDEPISYQDIWIPETQYELNLPATGPAEKLDTSPPPLTPI